MSLLHALEANSTRHTYPFLHWTIDQPFTPDCCRDVAQAIVPEVQREYDGTRAGDAKVKGATAPSRCYVTTENATSFPHLAQVIDELMSRDVIEITEQMLARSIENAYLRVEVISDREGFWLAPHKDIKEKLMSMLLYVNPHDESENLGTDLYDADHKLVKTVPYRHNFGYMFAPAHDTWHGLEKKAIQKERRSVLINYVTFETCWKLPERPARRAAA